MACFAIRWDGTVILLENAEYLILIIFTQCFLKIHKAVKSDRTAETDHGRFTYPKF